jgi:putative DNA primase/helicase
MMPIKNSSTSVAATPIESPDVVVNVETPVASAIQATFPAKPDGLAAAPDTGAKGAKFLTASDCHAANMQQVVQALKCIPAHDYDIWIKVGMALRDEFGEEGFILFGKWSRTATNYDPKAVVSAWKSFNKSGGVGIGTVFYIAKKHGYKPDGKIKFTAQTAKEIAKIEAKFMADAEELELQHAGVAKKATAIWNAAIMKDATPDHPYLKHKGVQPHGAKIYKGLLNIKDMPCEGALMIPTLIDGKITSLAFISPDGEKRYMYKGEIGSYIIGTIAAGKPVCICEGFATAASVHEATGYATVVAFDAGKMTKVAKAVRAANLDAGIVICGEVDTSKTGQTMAEKAAQAVGGLIAMPVFPEAKEGENPKERSDFNDMARLVGLEAVKQQIDIAQPALPVAPAAPVVGILVAANDAAGDSCDADDAGGGEAASAWIGIVWPAPQPLVAESAAEPYPLPALPNLVRAAVEESCGYVQAPEALVASSALSALSLAIQPLYDVQRADGLLSPVSAYLLLFADSGERKTSVDGKFTQAIRAYEKAQAEATKPLVKKYKAALAAWESKKKGLNDKIRVLAKNNESTKPIEAQLESMEFDKPEPPRIPRLIYVDVTTEELAYRLATSYPSAGVISSEAGVVFGSHSMGGESVMRNLTRFNMLWDGVPLPIDRRTSESFTVNGARVTLGLQVQPETFYSFFEKFGVLARGSGFLARFLFAFPESTQGNRPFADAPKDCPNLTAFNDRITAILEQPLPISDDGVLIPQVLTLEPEAKEVWVSYYNKIESKLMPGGELYVVRDFASKSAEIAARVAALFHVFDGKSGAICTPYKNEHLCWLRYF